MDFFKGLFGSKTPPPAAKPTATQTVQKTGPSKIGPLTHPSYPHLVFACVLVPANAPEEFPMFAFYLWERGVASYYRYQAKKVGDKTPATLMAAFSDPLAGWGLSDPSVSPTTAVIINISGTPQSASSSASPTKTQTGNDRKVTVKLAPRPAPIEDSAEAPTATHPSLEFFKDMAMSYLDRLNKLLLVVDKKLKVNSEYNDQIHASIYASVLEATRLTYHIYHDSSLDTQRKQTRYKMLNEWITRMLLALDNVTIPMIKASPTSSSSHSPGMEEDEFVLDPEKRARRKSLINLCLTIGAELSSMSGSALLSPVSTPVPVSHAPTSPEGSLEHFMWESPASSSPVHSLLALANPHPIASSN